MRLAAAVAVCLLLTGALAAADPGSASTSAPLLAQRPVVVIGVDGLSARAVGASPGFADILSDSAYTLRARTTEHTRSWEGWQAALMGGWDPGSDVGTGPRHPRLFAFVRSQMPRARLWFIGGAYRLFSHAAGAENADVLALTGRAEESVRYFEAAMLANASAPPDLAVMYFPDPDDTGHGAGWDTQAYNRTVERIAARIKRVRRAYPAALIFIISDHGGIVRGTSHAYNRENLDDPTVRDVPWIRYGDRRPGPLCGPVRNSDTAAEVARVLGIAPHGSWRTRAPGMAESYPCSRTGASARPLPNSAAPVCTLCGLVLVLVLVLGL
jgi:hypothetical protein